MKDRRSGITLKIEHDGQVFDIQFNMCPETGEWREAFYSRTAAVKHGSAYDALLSDACIAISKLLEGGHTFESLTKTFGEDRAPGAERGPPSSLLGAICAAGARL